MSTDSRDEPRIPIIGRITGDGDVQLTRPWPAPPARVEIPTQDDDARNQD